MTLNGIFTPSMVPLEPDSAINEDELRRYVDWLIERGVHGLYPNGSTGEFTRFTADERRSIIRIVCDQAGGRVPVLAGAAEANTRETLRACEAYLGYGASAVAIVSPYYYRLSSDAVYAYFSEIARNAPIDVTLYNIPLFSNPIDVRTVQRLAEWPRVVGIKDSSGDISNMLRMMSAVQPQRPDFVFMTGWDPALVAMLAMGCQGATLASSGVFPELTVRLYELASIQKNLTAALELQFKLTRLFDYLMSSADFPEGIRASLEMRGFMFGKSRQPCSNDRPLDNSRLASLVSELQL